MDDDGYLWYQGRSDDVFKAAGYRIGPSEIENCLVKHPAVANAAVVPKPDAERGALVKAYVVLAPGFARRRRARSSELQQHVRGKLAPYEYPKEIEFIDALPMTTTGKVQRRVLRLQEEESARAPREGAGRVKVRPATVQALAVSRLRRLPGIEDAARTVARRVHGFFVARPLGRQLDHVAVRVAEVDRIDEPVVGHAAHLHAEALRPFAIIVSSTAWSTSSAMCRS